MEMNKEQAAQALADIDGAQEGARAISMYKGADLMYALWGSVWIAAFMCQHFLPEDFFVEVYRWDDQHNATISGSGVFWPVFVLIGLVGSWLILRKYPGGISPKLAWIGPFWGLLYGFIYLWAWMLSGMVDIDAAATPESMRYFTAIATTIPMFAYVVMGMAGCGRYMIWLGLGLTAITVVGLLIAGSWFYLWMAVLGGGVLFVTGVVVHRKWRQACSS